MGVVSDVAESETEMKELFSALLLLLIQQRMLAEGADDREKMRWEKMNG